MHLKDFRKSLVQPDSPFNNSAREWGHRNFNGIQVGSVIVSVQASGSHYCEPRELLDDLTQYTAWEVALIDDNGNFFRPPSNNPLSRFWRNDDVAGFVPTEDVQKIYEWAFENYAPPVERLVVGAGEE